MPTDLYVLLIFSQYLYFGPISNYVHKLKLTSLNFFPSPFYPFPVLWYPPWNPARVFGERCELPHGSGRTGSGAFWAENHAPW